MRTDVTYTPCDTSLREQTGNIITFTHFGEGNILTKTSNDAESGGESNDDPIMPPLLIKEEMDAMDCGGESDNDLISAEILEDICYSSQSHLNVNRIEERYKIRDIIKQR